MKKLSYSTKSTTFLLLSVAVAIIEWNFPHFAWRALGDILWGLGIFFWGADHGQKRERRNRKSGPVNIYVTGSSVVQ